jgi:hypothetical protein
MKRYLAAMLVAAALAGAAADASAGENLWYSVFFPGWGQTRAGHYGRAALFAGGEVVSLVALAISDVQYDRAVEQYDRARAAYLGATYIGDAVEQYGVMREKWDDAESLHRYRRVAIGAAVGVWVVNIVDRVLFDETRVPPIAFAPRAGGFAVAASLSF